MNADIPFFVRCGAAAGMNNFLKIRNELRKKRTILALGGSVTRRRFTEPARAAVGFIRHSAAAGMSNRLLSPAPGLVTVARTANLLYFARV